MSSAFDYYSETKTGFGFNLKPVLLNRMRHRHKRHNINKIYITTRTQRINAFTKTHGPHDSCQTSSNMNHAARKFLADRTNGGAYATMLRLYVCLSVRLSVVCL